LLVIRKLRVIIEKKSLPDDSIAGRHNAFVMRELINELSAKR